MVKLTTIIILISLLTTFLQFGVFYLLDSPMIAFILSGLTVLICTHIFLELSLGYNACFLYSTLIIILTALICVPLYIVPESASTFGDVLALEHTLFLPNHNFYGVLFLNWFLPVLYCIARNLMDKGPRFVHFKKFFISSNIIFLIFFTISFIYQLFFNEFNFPFADSLEAGGPYIPFLALSSYVEAVFYGSAPFEPFLYFVGISLLLYVPIGFYTKLLLKHSFLPFRFLIYFAFPGLISLLRYLFNIHLFVTDNVLLGILGCLIGACLFNILNTIYLKVTDEEFLYEPSPFTSYIQRYGGR